MLPRVFDACARPLITSIYDRCPRMPPPPRPASAYTANVATPFGFARHFTAHVATAAERHTMPSLCRAFAADICHFDICARDARREHACSPAAIRLLTIRRPCLSCFAVQSIAAARLRPSPMPRVIYTRWALLECHFFFFFLYAPFLCRCVENDAAR